MKISGYLTLLAFVLTGLIYGDHPIVKVGQVGRTLITYFGSLAFCTIAVTAGMLLLSWLIDRYGDEPK